MYRGSWGRKGEPNGKKSKRKTKCERFLTLRNKPRVVGGRCVGGWGNWVMGVKGARDVTGAGCCTQLIVIEQHI